MSLPLLITLGVGYVILSLPVLVGAIWLAGRLWQVPDVSWRRAAWATLWLTLGSWLLLAAAYFVLLKMDGSEGVVLALSTCVVALALQLGLIVLGVGRPLRTGAIKAVCVGLTAYAAQSVVALALALACRQRLLEAFVVPTGAMAPTICGDHIDLICPNCGHAFGVSASHRQDRYRPQDEEIATCLNCNTEIPIAATAQVAGGDRVLVDKTMAARRWACVTFHEPSPARLVYVKRLVGLPGENIELAAGDVFIDGHRVRKHPRQQTDLWLPRHDTKSVPRGHDDDTPRWQPAAADSRWTQAGEGGWSFDGITAGAGALEFQGEITDACEYDAQHALDDRQYRPLGDVRVTCNVTTFSGPGSLRLAWQFGGQDLRCSVSNRNAEIANNDGQLASNETGKFIRPGEPLEFSIRDGTAYVLCGEDEVAANFLPDSLDDAKAESSGPGNPCRMRLIAEQCRVEISRVRIDRDIYYVSRDEMERRVGFIGDEGKGFSAKLGPDEYFMLGDNVLASKDSRFIGPIRAAELIGVARWRYWPKARWHTLD